MGQGDTTAAAVSDSNITTTAVTVVIPAPAANNGESLLYLLFVFFVDSPTLRDGAVEPVSGDQIFRH